MPLMNADSYYNNLDKHSGTLTGAVVSVEEFKKRSRHILKIYPQLINVGVIYWDGEYFRKEV